MCAPLALTKIPFAMFLSRLARSFSTLRKKPPLYAHENGDKISISFSKNPQATAIGRFPKSDAELLEGLSSELDPFEPMRVLNPKNFEENPEFWPIAQNVLKENIHLCPIFSSLATADEAQYFHIYDLRNPPPPNRIPEVDDILGTVEIVDGKIKKNSFEPNAMYRPVSPYGAMAVSEEIAAKLAQALYK